MVHYRGRFRKRPYTARQIFNMRNRRRKFNRKRKNRNPYKRATRIAKKNTKILRRLPLGSIMRPFSRPTTKIYRTCQTTQTVLNAVTINGLNGIYQYFFTIGDTMMSMDYTYIQTMYTYIQLIGFDVQFTITASANLVQLSSVPNVTGDTFMPVQVTDLGRNAPDMGIIFHIDGTQGGTNQQYYYYGNLNNTVTANRSKWFTNPKAQRLTQRTRPHYKWRCPPGLHGSFANTNNGQTILSQLRLFASYYQINIPSAFSLCWFDVADYDLSGNAGESSTVTLNINIQAVWQLRDPIPGV